MKSEKTLSAASYPSRIFKNDVTIKCSDCMVLCSGGCLTVAANSKNKETTTSLFFSRRQRSKVIFRVTQKSPAGSFAFPRKPCSARLSTLPTSPGGCSWQGLQQAVCSASDGRRTVGLSCTCWYRELLHNHIIKCYGK